MYIHCPTSVTQSLSGSTGTRILDQDTLMRGRRCAVCPTSSGAQQTNVHCTTVYTHDSVCLAIGKHWPPFHGHLAPSQPATLIPTLIRCPHSWGYQTRLYRNTCTILLTKIKAVGPFLTYSPRLTSHSLPSLTPQHSPELPVLSCFRGVSPALPLPPPAVGESHIVTPPSRRTASRPVWMAAEAEPVPHTTFHRFSTPSVSVCSPRRWCLLSWERVIWVAPTLDMLLILSAELSPLLLSEYRRVTWIHFCLSWARYRCAVLPIVHGKNNHCVTLYTTYKEEHTRTRMLKDSFRGRHETHHNTQSVHVLHRPQVIRQYLISGSAGTKYDSWAANMGKTDPVLPQTTWTGSVQGNHSQAVPHKSARLQLHSMKTHSTHARTFAFIPMRVYIEWYYKEKYKKGEGERGRAKRG